ncbi:MAG: DUF21 domain-containing protein, partial [Bacteroidota bacterium]
MESEQQFSCAILCALFLFATNTTPVEVVVATILILLLLMGSALVSSSEVAFFSLSPNDFEKLEQENSAVGNQIIFLNNRPRYLLATILISNNFINIAIVILSDFVIRQLLPPELITGWAEQLGALFSIRQTETIATFARIIEVFIT